jgi:hypothetical protein
MRRVRARIALAAAVVGAFLAARPRVAAAEEPPAPPPPAEAPVVQPPVVDAPAGPRRPLPPDPPPPKPDIEDWDASWQNREVPLGPPLPPPDPWLPRDILYRHDTRDVSADGRLKPVKRVPQWVDVIDRTEIEEWRPLDLGDFARRMPNVIVSDGGSPFLQVPTIRGFGGDRVKIMTDGVWPSTQALAYHGGTLSLWDPETVQRMEIYHGPGAYLRGIDSPGGVINIVPRRPRRHGCWTADLGLASSYHSPSKKFRERADLDFGADRVAALVGATWTDVGHRHTGDGTTVIPSEYQSFAADAAVDYFLDNQSTLGVTAQYMKAYDIDAPAGVQTGLSDPEYERMFLALTLSSFDAGPVFHGSRVSIALDTIFQESDDAFSGQNAGLGAQNDVTRFDFHLEGNLYLHPCHQTWAELSVSYAHLERTETLLCGGAGPVIPKPGVPDGIDDHQDLIHAVEGGHDEGHHGGVFAVLGNCNTVIQSYEAEEWAVTGIIEAQQHDECWDKYVGARGDWYHYEDGRNGETTDRFLGGVAAGVCRHFTPHVTGFANASFGWRRPTIHEKTAIFVVDGLTVIGNADLDPEFHVNAEVGVKASWRNRASIQAAVFGHYTDEYIAPQPLVPLALNQAMLENLGDAVLYGGEITGALRPITTIEGLEIFGSAGITLSTDEDLIESMPVTWRTGARYSVPQPKGYRVRRWFGELALLGASDSTDGPRGGDAFVTGEALVGTGIHLGGWKAGWINVGVTNLFDADYTPPGSLIPAAGIGVIANISLKW